MCGEYVSNHKEKRHWIDDVFYYIGNTIATLALVVYYILCWPWVLQERYYADRPADKDDVTRLGALLLTIIWIISIVVVAGLLTGAFKSTATALG